ncbi:MAG: preprotein translocase subunit SecE [Bacteroidaceae bacterium]|nr:preprotein translocase subunit SecE [Bacteroidaceae bacterium]
MKIINYCKASYEELVHQVTWPSGKELMGSAVVVLIASLCIAVLVFGVDTLFDKGMQFIYGLAK